MPFDISISSFATNTLLARFIAAQRSFTGAGGAREVVESFGFTIGSYIERGRVGTVPQWSAYDVGDAVIVLIDGIWTPQQAAAIYNAATQLPVPRPTPNVNAAAGGDAASIAARLLQVWGGQGKRLVLAGYSYGGVLAEITAVLSNRPGQWKAVEVCTFGAFRPGDATFATSLQAVSVHRWMNDNDPVPRFPPHMQEAPFAVVTVGPFTAAVWMQYVQTGGGLMLTTTGSFQPADVPTARLTPADVDLLLWLSGIDSGLVAGHSIALYAERLSKAQALLKPGENGLLMGSPAEPFVPPVQQLFQAAIADAAALTSSSSAKGAKLVPYIPVPYRPKAVVVAGAFQVSWMGFTICTCPTKSAAKTTAKYLFKFLRVVQQDSTMSVSQLANAWAAFWAVAVSSSLGFDPPFTVSP